MVIVNKMLSYIIRGHPSGISRALKVKMKIYDFHYIVELLASEDTYSLQVGLLTIFLISIITPSPLDSKL
jgi:hypothetical protein